MIYGFFGSVPGSPHQRGFHALRGNGKTLCLTFTGYLDYQNGRKVISNYYTTFSEVVSTDKISDMVDNDNLQNVTILLSELQLYLNSLGGNTKNLRKFIGNVIGQSRKRNVDIHYDTQRYQDIHVRMRVQTDRVFIPRKYHYDGSPCQFDRCKQPHIIWLYQHEPYIKEPVISLKPEIVGKLYDSRELVSINYK